MRFVLLISLFLAQSVVLCAAVDPKGEPPPTPLMRTVEPYFAKAGMEVLVTGDNLGVKSIGELYLSCEGTNFKAEILNQTENELKFKVPAIKPGTYKLVVLTKGVEPFLIEEPVRMVVQE